MAPRRKLKTMLMQTFGVTKSIMVYYGIFCSVQLPKVIMTSA